MPEPAKRDPRVDPEPGDVLSGLNGYRHEKRRVICVLLSESQKDSRHVFYSLGQVRTAVKSLDEWQSWARKADVIHAAE